MGALPKLEARGSHGRAEGYNGFLHRGPEGSSYTSDQDDMFWTFVNTAKSCTGTRIYMIVSGSASQSRK